MAKQLTKVKDSLDRFLFEAKMCAREQYGFAAMLTAFSVMLGVSEATSEKTHNADLLEWFALQMDGIDSWLVSPDAKPPTHKTVAQKLAQIRDSLSHQISLPSDVVLVNSIEEGRSQSGQNPGSYFISTQDFVATVERAVAKIVVSHSMAGFDPTGPDRYYGRDVANRNVTSKGDISSASVSVYVPRVSQEKESSD